MIATKPDTELLEIVAQAHDQLHKGHIANAHELLHKALGVDNSVGVAMPSEPLSHCIGFNAGFIELCRLHNAKAAFVLADKTDAQGNTRLLGGGDQDLDAFLTRVLRGVK